MMETREYGLQEKVVAIFRFSLSKQWNSYVITYLKNSYQQCIPIVILYCVAHLDENNENKKKVRLDFGT